MSDVGNKLKQIVQNQVGSIAPTDFFFATMVSPTQIQLDNSEGPIPESLTIIPRWLQVFKLKIIDSDLDVNLKGTLTENNEHGNVNHEGEVKESKHNGEVTIDNTLKAGDRVIVFRKTGGQHFLVLGRLPN